MSIHNDDTSPAPQCQRCRSSPATQDVRTQKLCDDCFAIYIRTRPIKRLEAIRGNIKLPPSHPRQHDANKPTTTAPTYLLALSGGPTSLSLLHALDTHITSMKLKTGRSSYALHVVHIPPSSSPPSPTLSLASLRTAFPQHTFSSLALSSALDSWPAPDSLTSRIPAYAALSAAGKLSALLSLAASPTARADLETQLRAAALLAFAAAHACPVVLLGSSATALAQLVLAETAKGRGADVVARLAEAPSDTAAGVRVAYPMRDLLRADVGRYVRVVLRDAMEKGLMVPEDEAKGRVRALRSVAIDELAGTYFADVEGKFPGIVHNVVRTVGKLDAEAGAAAAAAEGGGDGDGERGGGRCACCGDVVGGSGIRTDVVVGMCRRCERDFGVGAG